MPSEMNRRDFVKGSLAAGMALSAAGAAGAAAAPAQAPAAPAESGPKAVIPSGRIGNLEVSRMLLGGNLLTHYCHSRDLRYVYDLTQHYNTDEKIIETMCIAEEHGINTLSVHTVPHTLEVLARHRKQGGKMKWIICSTAKIEKGLSEYSQATRKMVDDGTDALYLWGVQADALLKAGTPELIGEAVEAMKLNGVPVGIGAHELGVVEWCEKNGVRNDFYIKTFHHHQYKTAPTPEELKALDEKAGREVAYSEIPGYWCRNPEKTIAVMQEVKKPWIAFKVMAAGAIPAKDAFTYVFKNGADFTLAGMFDFEIAKDAELINGILKPELPKRKRPWLG